MGVKGCEVPFKGVVVSSTLGIAAERASENNHGCVFAEIFFKGKK